MEQSLFHYQCGLIYLCIKLSKQIISKNINNFSPKIFSNKLIVLLLLFVMPSARLISQTSFRNVCARRMQLPFKSYHSDECMNALMFPENYCSYWKGISRLGTSPPHTESNFCNFLKYSPKFVCYLFFQVFLENERIVRMEICRHAK